MRCLWKLQQSKNGHTCICNQECESLNAALCTLDSGTETPTCCVKVVPALWLLYSQIQHRSLR